MPCSYDPTPLEIEAGKRRAQQQVKDATDSVKNKTKAQTLEIQVNALSVELDFTRDLIFRMVQDMESEGVGFNDITIHDDAEKVLKKQDKHRQDDLDRLIKTLGKNPTKKNRELLKKVLDADPTKPLEPQLGFDPDSM